MRFQALERSLKAIEALREPVRVLRTVDPKLADQVKRAASSVSLNLSEGQRRVGKDRLHHWRIAAGSASEARTALRVAEAWGDLKVSQVTEALKLLDEVLAVLWTLTHGKKS